MMQSRGRVSEHCEDEEHSLCDGFSNEADEELEECDCKCHL